MHKDAFALPLYIAEARLRAASKSAFENLEVNDSNSDDATNIPNLFRDISVVFRPEEITARSSSFKSLVKYDSSNEKISKIPNPEMSVPNGDLENEVLSDGLNRLSNLPRNPFSILDGDENWNSQLGFSESDFFSSAAAKEMLNKDFAEGQQLQPTIDIRASNWTPPSEVTAPSFLSLSDPRRQISIGTLFQARSEQVGTLSNDKESKKPYFGVEATTPPKPEEAVDPDDGSYYYFRDLDVSEILDEMLLENHHTLASEIMRKINPDNTKEPRIHQGNQDCMGGAQACASGGPNMLRNSFEYDDQGTRPIPAEEPPCLSRTVNGVLYIKKEIKVEKKHICKLPWGIHRYINRSRSGKSRRTRLHISYYFLGMGMHNLC